MSKDEAGTHEADKKRKVARLSRTGNDWRNPMKKEVTICFRTTDRLRMSLEEAAREDRRSLSSLIEIVLTDYLEKVNALPARLEDRYAENKAAVTVL